MTGCLVRGLSMVILGSVVSSALAVSPRESPQPITAAKAVETTRFVLNPRAVDAQNPHGAVSISPAGTRYVARLVRGDVQRNQVELRIISGELASLESASAWTEVTRLYSSGLGGGLWASLAPAMDTSAEMSPLRWIDEERIVFPWSDAQGRRQVVEVNVVSGDVRWRTDHAQSVGQFDVAGDVVLYNAAADLGPRSVEPGQAGFVVDARTDGYSALHGDFSGLTIADRRMTTQWFLRHGTDAPLPVRINDESDDLDVRHRVSLTRSGRFAVIDSAPATIPRDWERYTWRDMRQYLADAERDPHALGGARNVHQLYVVELSTRKARPLWNAVSLAWITQTAWSPDERSVLVAPTALPTQDSAANGLEGRAAAVVDVATGTYALLPVELPSDVPVDSLRFVSRRVLEIGQRQHDQSVRILRFERRAEVWVRTDAPESSRPQRICVRVEQDLNTPPRLVAEAEGKKALVLDPNPGLLDSVRLGRVARLDGALKSGERWSALLFHPVHYEPGRRYPLVIQSAYGRSPNDEFTLFGLQYGAGLGPTLTASYAGQMLAARDIAVLHLNVRIGKVYDTPAEAPTWQRAFEEAAQQLADRGIIDPARVGLLGFSRNGYYVEYALTHSHFPFAAAVAADNWDPSYVQQVLSGTTAATSSVTGAEPFGEGLHQWLAHAPGFNADKVRAPLRMVEQSHGGTMGVLGKWELFSRLRYLRKPVEFYVMPDITHGAHNTQNPAQILAVQGSTVDWFDYWLNNREDGSGDKREQYERWRGLRKLHEADSAPTPITERVH